MFTTLGRHPRLFRTWLRFSATLLLRGDLPGADRELVILRTAWRCGSWYEWAQHGALAAGSGLVAHDLERVIEGPGAAGWRPRQRLLLMAADELHDHRVITDRTWAALATELTERELIELCLLVGHYEMLAMTLNSLGVEPEPTTLARLSGGAADAAGAPACGARGGPRRPRSTSERGPLTSPAAVTGARARRRRPRPAPAETRSVVFPSNPPRETSGSSATPRAAVWTRWRLAGATSCLRRDTEAPGQRVQEVPCQGCGHHEIDVARGHAHGRPAAWPPRPPPTCPPPRRSSGS